MTFVACRPEATADGYTVTESNLRISKFDVTATCAKGYVGSASVAACDADGASYTLSGCELDPVCLAPEQVSGYVLTETDLRKSKFAVAAKCDVGYLGDASVTPCSSHGGRYGVTGCELDPVCLAPEQVSGYLLTETDLHKSKFAVAAKCDVGYLGKASVTPCSSHGGTYGVTGCELDPVCLAPEKDLAGYILTETDLHQSKFAVAAECVEGYIGSPSVTACSSHGGSYEVMGCELDPVCLSPDKGMEAYALTEVNLQKSKFEVTAKCAAGYLGSASVTACESNTGRYGVTGCKRDPVCLAPETLEGYVLKEVNLHKSKFDVTAECAAGFLGAASVTPCSSHGGTYEVTGCERDPVCVAPATSLEGYSVTETNLHESKFDVSASCARGYIGSASVSVCSGHGKGYQVAGCELDPVCLAPKKAIGYKFREYQLSVSTFNVSVECAKGYIGSATVEACTKDGEAFTFSGCELDPVCVAPSKVPAGYKVTENSLLKSSFNVKVECARGYLGKPSIKACAGNAEEYELSGCKLDPVCLAPVGTEAKGYAITEKSLAHSTFDVDAKCKDGYVGSASVTKCSADGKRYSLSGCEVDPVCVAPPTKWGYKITEHNLQLSKFSVDVECAPGFLGQPSITECTKNGGQYVVDGCELDPVCLAPTKAAGYKFTETELRVSKFDVTAECAEGYVGKALVETCSKDGQEFSLSGCELDPLCLAPQSSAAYEMTEKSLLKSSFDVEVKCGKGYTGTPSVTPCTSNGETYQVSGCELDPVCLAPAKLAGYKITEAAITVGTFDVTAECAAGYVGKAKVLACVNNGEEYTLSGCEAETFCLAPKDAAGYTVTETNVGKSAFDVTATCSAGYSGTAAVTPCSADGETYTLSGCQKDKLCVAPSDARGYVITEASLVASSFDVSAKCSAGYTGSATATACSADGESYTLSGCEKDKLCVAPTDAAGYVVTEASLVASSFDVSAKCSVGYVGSATATACSADGESYTLSGCEKDKLCVAPTDAAGYVVTEASLSGSSFDVSAKCSVGYVGSATATACSADGESYTLSGCDKDKLCVAPVAAEGYKVTETALTKSKFDVAAECADGFLGTASTSACSTDGGEYVLSGCEKEKYCVAPTDSTGYTLDEVSLASSTFNVKASCASGYSGTARVSPCSADGQAYTLSGCSKR